jgi:transposase-like protein
MSDSPARHLNLAGTSNFRDLGGYRATDGRTVRWRQIFRSNHLGHLTDADIEVLRPLALKSAFDFRGAEERVAAMCGLQEIVVHSLLIEPTVVGAARAPRRRRGAVIGRRAGSNARGVHMGRPSKLTPHQRDEATQALLNGTATQADLARRFNVSQSTISRHWSQSGALRPSLPRTTFGPVPRDHRARAPRSDVPGA